MNWTILWAKIAGVLTAVKKGEANGKYELLKSDTLAEEVGAISVDIPACRKVIFKAAVPAGEVASNITPLVTFDDGTSWTLLTFNTGIATTKTNWYFEVYPDSGYYRTNGILSNNYDSVACSSFHTVPSRLNTVTTDKLISNFTVIPSAYGPKFPIGTKFEVWGCKE